MEGSDNKGLVGGTGGRPSKFDTKRADTILTLIRGGNTKKAAAAAALISTRTLEMWIKAGKEEAALRGDGDESQGSELFRFFRAFTRAESEAEIMMQNSIREAAMGYRTKKVTTRTHTKIEVVRKPDGSPILDKKTGKPLTVEISDTVTTTEEDDEKDWRAGESWLKRRNPADWGDRLDINKLDDETLLRLLQRDAEYQAALDEKAEN